MFNRRAAMACAAAAFVVLAAPVGAEAPGLTPFDQTTFDTALEAGKPVLVEISAPWCPTCKAQKAVLGDLLADPRFADLVHLEVDFDSRKDVVRSLGATQQSTLIVYAGGAEVGRSVGETRPDAIADLVGAAF